MVQNRSAIIAVLALATLFILPQGLTLGLPDSGEEMVLSQNATLEIGPSESAKMNGSLIINGTGGRRVLVLIRNRGNLSLAEASFLCENSDLLIENYGRLQGTYLGLKSLQGGNLTCKNEATVDTVLTNLSATGGTLAFCNLGNFTVNRSKTSGERGTTSRLELRSAAGIMSLRNDGMLVAGNLNSRCVNSGRTEIDNAATLELGNGSIHTNSSGVTIFLNSGNVTVNNFSVQAYDGEFLLQNMFGFRGNSMYFKSEWDETGGASGLTIRDLAELDMENLCMVSNGAWGRVALSCQGKTKIGNADLDADYGGNISVHSQTGSDLHVGNANLDSSGISHGLKSRITVETRGSTTIDNLNVKNRYTVLRMVYNGTTFIGKQVVNNSGWGKISIVNGGKSLYGDLRVLANRGEIHVLNEGRLEVDHMEVRESGDLGGPVLIQDRGEMVLGNASLLCKDLGLFEVLVLGRTAIDDLNAEAKDGGMIIIHSENGSELNIENCRLASSGWSHGQQSRLKVITEGSCTIENLSVEVRSGVAEIACNGSFYIGNQVLNQTGWGQTSVLFDGDCSSENLYAVVDGGILEFEMRGVFLNRGLLETLSGETRARMSGHISDLEAIADGQESEVFVNFTTIQLGRLCLRALFGGSIDYTATEANIGEMCLDVSGANEERESRIDMDNGDLVVVERTEVEGFELQNTTAPGGPQTWVLRFPEGTIEMSNSGSTIPISEFAVWPVILLWVGAVNSISRRR